MIVPPNCRDTIHLVLHLFTLMAWWINPENLDFPNWNSIELQSSNIHSDATVKYVIAICWHASLVTWYAFSYTPHNKSRLNGTATSGLEGRVPQLISQPRKAFCLDAFQAISINFFNSRHTKMARECNEDSGMCRKENLSILSSFFNAEQFANHDSMLYPIAQQSNANVDLQYFCFLSIWSVVCFHPQAYRSPTSFLKGPFFRKKMWFRSKLAGLPVQGHFISCRWNLKLALLNVGPALTAQLITSLVNNIFLWVECHFFTSSLTDRQRSAQ